MTHPAKMKDDWDDCPTEILCIIFKYLDTKSLTRCMLVNKKWKDIAEHTAEYYKLWESLVKKEMINKGATFIRKSTLNWKHILKNSILWHHANLAAVHHYKTYEVQGVKKMNVYKDNLILVTKTRVLYYDIKTFSLIRDFDSTCLNFEENDNMIVELVPHEDMSQKLRLYIKLNADLFEMDLLTRHTVNDIRLYRLESACYVLTTANILWSVSHKVSRWDVEFLGRYFGSDYDPITALHVYNECVYIVTKWGSVWYGDTQSVRFLKVYKLHVPVNIGQYNWVMFDTFSSVVSVTKSKKARVKYNYDPKSAAIMLECAELTCATEHGDVLLLGYNDGRVEIRMPKKNMNNPLPDRYFNIQQFYEHVDDSTIVGLNVCEVENSHMLLVSTRGHVFQLRLAYPESVL